MNAAVSGRSLHRVLLAIVILCAYLATGSSDLRNNGDTVLRYQTSQALVDHHRAWLSDPASRDTRVAVGRGGHLYAFYAPGQAVLMAPLYVIGKVLAHHLHLPYDITTLYATHSLDLFLGWLLALLVYETCCLIGYSRRVSVVLTLIFAFATVAWPDAQSGLEQTQVDFFLLLAVYCCARSSWGRQSSRWWLAGAGSAMGAAVFTRYDALIYVPILAGYVWLAHRSGYRSRRALVDLTVCGLGLAPWLLLVALWNVWRFGSPFLTGLHQQTFGEPFLSGLAGLLVSPGKGLVWYLPLVFLLPFALRDFYRRNRAFFALCAVLVITPIAFYSNVLYWHGDPAWGPRYLYTAVPYLIIPLGEILSRFRVARRSLKAAVLGLTAMSLCINVAAVSLNPWRFWYHLQATLQSESSAADWSGQPFYWGASHYHYYWNVEQSPILLQLDGLSQVARLHLLGETRYDLTGHPDPYTYTTPAENYTINTLSFWWADTLHPLLGQRTRAAIALLLAVAGLAAAGALYFTLRETSGSSSDEVADRERRAWRRAVS